MSKGPVAKKKYSSVVVSLDQRRGRSFSWDMFGSNSLITMRLGSISSSAQAKPLTIFLIKWRNFTQRWS